MNLIFLPTFFYCGSWEYWRFGCFKSLLTATTSFFRLVFHLLLKKAEMIGHKSRKPVSLFFHKKGVPLPFCSGFTAALNDVLMAFLVLVRFFDFDTIRHMPASNPYCVICMAMRFLLFVASVFDHSEWLIANAATKLSMHEIIPHQSNHFICMTKEETRRSSNHLTMGQSLCLFS